MKKILSLLFLSSSLFSMQLALKMQTPRFDRAKSALVKQQKAILWQTNQLASQGGTTSKVYIEASSIRAPHSLSDIQLYHGKKGFIVLHDDKKHIIEKAFMDETACNITREGLKSFLKTGYFALNQTNDGTFTLKAHHRLLGGGPIFGSIMYWVTKSVCYGVALAAVTTVAVTTGGTAVLAVSGGAAAAGGIAVGATAAATGAAITTTAGVVTAGTTTAALVSGGATVIGGALANAGAGAVAAKATVAVVSSAGGIGATVAGVESLSVAIGTFFGMLPTP